MSFISNIGCNQCSSCCIAYSPTVSYCGMISECNASNKLSDGIAVGMSLLTLVVVIGLLIGVYFIGRDRVIEGSNM